VNTGDPQTRVLEMHTKLHREGQGARCRSHHGPSRHGLVESRMRGNMHVRFGGRVGGDDWPKGQHRAPGPTLCDTWVTRLARGR
jgi:hypothetical protein